MEKQISIVAALHIGFSIIYLLTGMFIFLLLSGIGIVSADETAMLVLSSIGAFVATILVIIALPGILGGVGLLYRKNWARLLIIVISVFDLLNVPVGTAIGIYSIWVLMDKENVEIFT